MNTTLSSNSNSSLLIPSIPSSINESLSTQNDTVSEDEEQQHTPPKRKEPTKNIKRETDDNKSTDNKNVNLDYNDLIVALWNMVEHNTNTPNTDDNASKICKTSKTNKNSDNNNNNSTNNASLHLLHSTLESDVNIDDDDDDDDIMNESVPFSFKKSRKNTVITNNRRGEVPHASVLRYCPNYTVYDERARKESKERISSHLSERQKLVRKCIDLAISEVTALGLEFDRTRLKYVLFRDNGDILRSALDHLSEQIDSWDGVQIKQCKKEKEDGTPIIIDSWQKFAKKAKNHQDQTSWKISGDYFFAPYIARVNRYINEYIQCLINISDGFKSEIMKLGSLSFAQNLLNGKIKFHRTKLKPLIRHRTLVKSSGIHIELENLCAKLTIRKFIQNAKAKRKENDGKSNIIAGDFYDELIKYVESQYDEQKKLVYDLLAHYKKQPITMKQRTQISPQKPPPPLPIIAIPPINLPAIMSVPPAINLATYALPTINCNKKKRKLIYNNNNNNICNKRRKIEIDRYCIDVEYILNACNGSCGNKLGAFIANIIAPTKYKYGKLSAQQELNILSLKFGVYGNKMRDLFISLNSSENDDNFKLITNKLMISLRDENVYISNRLCRDENWILRFVEAFESCSNKNILQHIADASCRKQINCELLQEVERNAIQIINVSDLYNKIDDIKRENKYYQYMKLHSNASNEALSHNEILSIMIFMDNLNVIYINEWCKNGNGCKWKQLFKHLTSAIHKIYKCFVYKNDEYNKEFKNQLFYKQCQPFNIITVLYSNNSINIHQNNKKTLQNAQNLLYNGKFIAAPIDWIIFNDNFNNNQEKKLINFKNNVQWLSLPTNIL